MDIHVRRLGTLNILFGVISLLTSLGLLLFFGGPVGIYESTDDNILGLLVSVSTVGHILLAVPCIVGGFFIRSTEEWSRGLLIVTSALNIINVPLGSILGAYGLWVLLTPETDPLFSQPRTPQVANKAVAQEAQPVKQKSATNTIVPSPRS